MGFSPGEKHYTTTSIFSNIIDAATGSFTEGLTVSGTPVNTGPSSVAAEYILLKDEKPNNTAGGTLTSGDWRTRVLNTISHDDTGVVTLVANQFTLPAGTYETIASGPGSGNGQHVIRLRNITDGTTVAIGTPHQAGVETAASNLSILYAKFTITASKTFELQHRCITTKATYGLGVQGNVGSTEVYGQVSLSKVA